jgi:hypothetical protein
MTDKILECPCLKSGHVDLVEVVTELHNKLGEFVKEHDLCTAIMMKMLAVECGSLVSLSGLTVPQTVDVVSEIVDCIEAGYNGSGQKQLHVGSFDVTVGEPEIIN